MIDVSVGLLHGSVMRVQMLREAEVRMNRDVRVGKGNFSVVQNEKECGSLRKCLSSTL